MIICICRRVSDRDIARAARNGCASFEELQLELSVATGCGKCHDCARETFDQHAALVRPPRAAPGFGAHPVNGRVIAIANQQLSGSTALAVD